jgi:tRNA (cytidine/uridine-2'-O-)-methyltransferase|tara:strand:+ start:662 stop:1105 length:444 start_codon:yes stop_codon:yes gene_type:complete
MNLAIFQPDIPQNTGAIIRSCACFNVSLDIIHPASFTLSEKSLNRVAMDYADKLNITEHNSWIDYKEKIRGRIILLSTHGKIDHTSLDFKINDNLLVGKESAGVPDYVHREVDEIIRIPMQKNTRSLNVSVASAIVMSEANRQLNLV